MGLLLLAGIYPLLEPNQSEVLQMFLGVYATLGVFLLLASRNPTAHRSLIGFTAWSSLVHAAIMAVQAVHDVSGRHHLLFGVALFAIIGAVLIVLAPQLRNSEKGKPLAN